MAEASAPGSVKHEDFKMTKGGSGCGGALAAAFTVFLVLAAIGGLLDDEKPSRRSSSSTPERTAPLTKQSAAIHLAGWTWEKTSQFAITRGQVRNNSRETIDRLQVVVTFTDAAGKFITSDSSYVEYTTLLPGQTSPFTIYTDWNPAMKSSTLEFQVRGKKVPHWDAR